MARRPRQRQTQEIRTIEIKRNVIEQFLMDAKHFVKNNRKFALYSLIGLVGAVVIAIALVVAVSYFKSVNEERLDVILDRLSKIKGPSEKAGMDAVIADLKKQTDATFFGFSHDAAYYVLGNIYYDRKEWATAKRYLVDYADRDGKNVLAPIALIKAALALEEAKDLKGAVEIYRRLEERYADSAVADQLFYNYARVCALNGDKLNARMYYNKVISSFPESGYVQQAKKRLFVLGPN